jgi:hypothetical protein
MQKLFSCLFGSHLYGTTHPLSDRDVKNVVLPSLDSLLLGSAPKNRFKPKDQEDGRDEENVPIHVLARDFLQGQTYALELVFAATCTGAEQTIYDPRFLTFCAELRERFLTSSMKETLGFARDQGSKYAYKGDRLNTVQDAIHLFSSFPADDTVMQHVEEFEERARVMAANYPAHFKLETYDADGHGNIQPCVKVLDKTYPYTKHFRDHVMSLHVMDKRYGKRAREAAKGGEGVDLKASMHAVRVLDQGILLLSEGTLTYPYSKDHATRLLRIRNGEVPIAEVGAQLTERIDTLEALSANSTLPMLTEELEGELEEWLLGWLHEFYFGGQLKSLLRDHEALEELESEHNWLKFGIWSLPPEPIEIQPAG